MNRQIFMWLAAAFLLALIVAIAARPSPSEAPEGVIGATSVDTL